MTDYICSKCGGGSVSVLASRPSLDDRYAVGRCLHCTADPKPDPRDPMRMKPTPTVPLVRADLWDPTKLERDRERRRVRRLFDPKTKLTPADQAERVRLLQAWAAEAAERSQGTGS